MIEVNRPTIYVRKSFGTINNQQSSMKYYILIIIASLLPTFMDRVENITYGFMCVYVCECVLKHWKTIWIKIKKKKKSNYGDFRHRIKIFNNNLSETRPQKQAIFWIAVHVHSVARTEFQNKKAKQKRKAKWPNTFKHKQNNLARCH